MESRDGDPQTASRYADRESIERILLRVWAAALDANALLAEAGMTEADYLAKQRHHIDRAIAEIETGEPPTKSCTGG